MTFGFHHGICFRIQRSLSYFNEIHYDIYEYPMEIQMLKEIIQNKSHLIEIFDMEEDFDLDGKMISSLLSSGTSINWKNTFRPIFDLHALWKARHIHSLFHVNCTIYHFELSNRCQKISWFASLNGDSNSLRDHLGTQFENAVRSVIERLKQNPRMPEYQILRHTISILCAITI